MNPDTMTVNGTLPVSASDREAWSPPDAPQRTYQLTPLTVVERPQIADAVNGAVGAYPSDDMVRWTLTQAALKAFDPEEAAEAVRLLDEHAALDKAGDKTDDEVTAVLATQKAAIDRLQTRLSWRDETVREIIVARSCWVETWMLFTARAVIRDWDGLAVPCRRRRYGMVQMVDDDAMKAVPDVDLKPLVARCHDWVEVTQAQEPGSVSP